MLTIFTACPAFYVSFLWQLEVAIPSWVSVKIDCLTPFGDDDMFE